MFESFVRSFFKEGALIVRLPNDNSIYVNGASEDTAPVIVRLRDAATALRIARKPGLAVGEAYMDGDLTLERGDIYDFMEVSTRNFRYRPKARGWIARWRKRLAHANARAVARRNVAHHYDLSDQLYRLFLDADRQYSCAYFPEPGMSLDDAQRAKKRHIAAKLLLQPNHRVLDIGCGWGGLALTLAAEHGARVHGVTLSTEQYEHGHRRVELRGLQDRVHIDLRDYRDVRGQYDRIVSVGMFEHVGPPNYDAYFQTIADRLTEEDGVALVHTIGRADVPGIANPWIEKYIFPGGYIPALSEILPAIERAGLIVADIEVLRRHYADTLRLWRERFKAQRAEAAALYDERFCRMWEFYLAGSEASFRVGSHVVFQIQLAKRQDAIPLTRDYITDFDRAGAQSVAMSAE